MESGLPNGTVTFLFTDIEGSTRIAQEHRGAWETLRARHHAILRATIEAHNGYVFQIIGDAFCAAFHVPGDAVRAAVETQRALHAEDWGEAPIRVRMGISTGEAEAVEQEYRGYLTLSFVQRVMSAAHGEQVLLAQAARDLIENDLPDSVGLRDLGECRLKGFQRKQHLHQLVIADLPSDFPPLTVLEAHPHNLPAHLTSFVGREREIEEVCQLVRQNRLVALTGVGGTGKTRLGLQAAADLLDEFKDGVWLVELAPLTDETLVPQAIATTLAVREQPGCSFLDLLKDYLTNKNLLLVLDNCEHLINACGQASDALLRAAPRLKILVTSREALGVSGETIYAVPSLALPVSSATSAEAVSPFDAARLFVDRARAVRPDFCLTDQNAPAVAQVCRRLDGIPLALELAAACVKGLSVEQIASRLGDRFRLLTGGSRTALPRQRTLQAAIDWSYQLLSENERSLLRRLAVFTGGWTLAAAESVCSGNGLDSDQVLPLLLRLIDKSLVLAETARSEPRYRMLETIRQYAQEKMDEAGQADPARARHLIFFVELAEQAEPQFRGPDSPLWIDRMEKERDNLRAAFNYAIDSGVADAALRIIGGAHFMWVLRGPYSEGQRLAETALAKSSGQRDAARARALWGLGFLIFEQSDFESARERWEQSLGIWKELQDKWWCAFLTGFIGEGIGARDPAAGSGFLRESLRLAQQTDDEWIVAFCLKALGESELQQGHLAEARPMLEESLRLIRALRDSVIRDEVLYLLGELAEVEGDPARALQLYEESLVWTRMSGESSYVGYIKLSIGGCLQRLGDNEKAADLFAEALDDSRQRGKKSSAVRALVGLGIVAAARGDAARAVRLIQAGLTLYGNLGADLYASHNEKGWVERCLASARAQLGEQGFAAACEEGKALGVEEAIAYALEQVDWKAA